MTKGGGKVHCRRKFQGDASLQFDIGDAVTWKSSHEVVPAGARGMVVPHNGCWSGFQPMVIAPDGTVKVKFPMGAWFFYPSELIKEENAATEERTDLEAIYTAGWSPRGLEKGKGKGESKGKGKGILPVREVHWTLEQRREKEMRFCQRQSKTVKPEKKQGAPSRKRKGFCCFHEHVWGNPLRSCGN